MPADLIVFPADRRIGKIRTTAANMLAKKTDRHAAFYREQITTSLWRQLETVGQSEGERHEYLMAFWHAVQMEMLRITHRGSRPGGSAA